MSTGLCIYNGYAFSFLGQSIVNYKKDGGLFECCFVMFWAFPDIVFVLYYFFASMWLSCFNCDIAAHMIDLDYQQVQSIGTLLES